MIWAVEEFLLQKHEKLCEMSNDNAQHLYSSGKTVHLWFKFLTPSAQMTVKCLWVCRFPWGGGGGEEVKASNWLAHYKVE